MDNEKPMTAEELLQWYRDHDVVPQQLSKMDRDTNSVITAGCGCCSHSEPLTTRVIEAIDRYMGVYEKSKEQQCGQQDK